MRDIDTWLYAMANESLPGGLSAAAVAAAMGSALIYKALRTSLIRQKMGLDEEALLTPVLDLAHRQQATLLRLATADEDAYLAVLATQESGENDRALIQARRTATEIPIRTAQAATQVLEALPPVEHLCWPIVMPDIDVGRMLLDAGRRTGILIAEANLRVWGDMGAGFQIELDALAAADQNATD